MIDIIKAQLKGSKLRKLRGKDDMLDKACVRLFTLLIGEYETAMKGKAKAQKAWNTEKAVKKLLDSVTECANVRASAELEAEIIVLDNFLEQHGTKLMTAEQCTAFILPILSAGTDGEDSRPAGMKEVMQYFGSTLKGQFDGKMVKELTLTLMKGRK